MLEHTAKAVAKAAGMANRRLEEIQRLSVQREAGVIQSGMGLMKCGNVVIPFDNTIDKGTDLYNLYNTNIHEKNAMEKMKK